jgi:hypothetical protein
LNTRRIINPLFWFLAVWFTVNIIQARFTELAHDEAYYWMFSKYPALGYFDHPPVIALIIRAGYLFFQNELGVRLIPCILGTGTLFLLYMLIDRRDRDLQFFIMLTMSIGLVSTHVCGFIAVPDTPLIFFTALFFYLYRKYLEDDNTVIAVLISIVIALMLYSKYHGLLVLFFTLISNFSLIRRKSFWLIILLSAVLMVPHLIWQINHDFPTLEYHLFSRSSFYKPGFTINYLYGQLLIAGPLIGIIILYHAFRYGNRNQFDKALKFNLAGTLVFFLLSSFRGHVEPHWTAIAYIPLIILSYKSINDTVKARKWIKILFWPSIAMFLCVRVLMAYDLLPRSWNILNEFHGWNTWASEIKETAGGRKVVFTNKYQHPSKYTFYSGEFAHTLNNIYYRRNQYDLWNFEDSIQGKSVMIMHSKTPTDTLVTGNGQIYDYQFIDNFRSYYGIKIEVTPDKRVTKRGEFLNMELLITNNSDRTIDFRDSNNKKSYLCYTYEHRGKFVSLPKKIYNAPLKIMDPHSSYTQRIKIPVPKKPGRYAVYISIVTGILKPAHNSNPVSIRVSE